MIDPDKLERLIKIRQDQAVELSRALDPENAFNMGGPRHPGRALTEEEQGEVGRLRKLLADIDADIARVTAGDKADAPEPPPESRRDTWKGTLRAFADVYHALYAVEWFHANSPRDAVRRACRHWQDKNGKPLTLESVERSLQERNREGKGPVKLPFELPPSSKKS